MIKGLVSLAIGFNENAAYIIIAIRKYYQQFGVQ